MEANILVMLDVCQVFVFLVLMCTRSIQTDLPNMYAAIPPCLFWDRLQRAGGDPYRAEGCDLQPFLAFKLPSWGQLQLAYSGRSRRSYYHQVESLKHMLHTYDISITESPKLMFHAPVSVTSTWRSQENAWETGSCWHLRGRENPGYVARCCRSPSSPPGGVFGSSSTLKPTALGKPKGSDSLTSEVSWRIFAYCLSTP